MASFFQKLTGGQFYEEDEEVVDTGSTTVEFEETEAVYEEAEEGQLAVDVYQTSDSIVIEAMVAAVKPEDLDINITRDMVTIRGSRSNGQHVDDANYFYRELYWGSFSRTIMLPKEVEPDDSDANIKNGLLTISMPKIDRGKANRVRVKVV